MGLLGIETPFAAFGEDDGGATSLDASFCFGRSDRLAVAVGGIMALRVC